MPTATQQQIEALCAEKAHALAEAHRMDAASNERLADYWLDRASYLSARIGQLRREQGR